MVAKATGLIDAELALTFDDVLLKPGPSSVLPVDVDTSTRLAGDITLNIPVISDRKSVV